MSRVVRTWGTSESGLAEPLARPHRRARRRRGRDRCRTIAFLASGIEGIKVRITAEAADRRRGRWRCSTPRRPRCGRRWPIGSATSSSASTTRRWRTRSARCCSTRGLTLGAGRVAHRWAHRRRVWSTCPGASEWFRGAIVSYDTAVKYAVLGRARRTSGRPRTRPGRWPTAPAGCSAPTSVSASPAWPARPNRRASRPGRSSSAWPCPTAGVESARAPPAGRPRPGPAVRRHLRARSPTADAVGTAGPVPGPLIPAPTGQPRPANPDRPTPTGGRQRANVRREGRQAVRGIEAEPVGQPLDRPERDVPLAPLQATHVRPMHPEDVSEVSWLSDRLLRQPRRAWPNWRCRAPSTGNTLLNGYLLVYRPIGSNTRHGPGGTGRWHCTTRAVWRLPSRRNVTSHSGSGPVGPRGRRRALGTPAGAPR